MVYFAEHVIKQWMWFQAKWIFNSISLWHFNGLKTFLFFYLKQGQLQLTTFQNHLHDIYMHLITIHFLGTHNRFHVCVSGVLFLLRFTCSGCFPGSNWPAAAPFSTQFNPAWGEPGEWKYCEDRPIWECCSNISEGLIDWKNVIVYKNAFFLLFQTRRKYFT